MIVAKLLVADLGKTTCGGKHFKSRKEPIISVCLYILVDIRYIMRRNLSVNIRLRMIA